MGALDCRELDRAHCSIPGCEHTAHRGLFLHSRCHPGRGLEVECRNRLLHIRCKVCKKPVAEVDVAEGGGA